jgi:hypothetical protein
MGADDRPVVVAVFVGIRVMAERHCLVAVERHVASEGLDAGRWCDAGRLLDDYGVRVRETGSP